MSAGGAAQFQHALVWVDREGREEPIGAPPRNYPIPRLSPDGTRIALDVRDQEQDIWIWDLGRETFDAAHVLPRHGLLSGVEPGRADRFLRLATGER